MIALLVAAAAQTTAIDAAAARSAVDAERAFAADAQQLGQWTAFRKWAAGDALMFVPQSVNAHEFLKDRNDPPVAVFWWPGRSYVSCDGTYAINTGPWVREWGKAVGYFTTVWQRQSDGGWNWIYDAGDELKVPRAEGGDITPAVAACPSLPLPPPPQREMPADVKSAQGTSNDGTLHWFWTVAADGGRRFTATLWDGQQRRLVVDDQVAPPAKP